MAIHFISTRGGGQSVSAAQAIVKGLHSDGGLFVPESIPVFSAQQLQSMVKMSYLDRAALLLSACLTDFTREELLAMCSAAYSRFDASGVAPVKALSGGVYSLELWHGPTLAFKDVALTLLPHLLTASARKTGETREVLILVATSGDTGKAALEGFMDVPGARCAVFYPQGGVSEAQRLQMVTQRGNNTHVIAVRGNFDDAQTGVKRIFSDPEANSLFAAKNRVLSSANSINFGRLAPQIVYYFSSYMDLVKSGALRMGDPINFCVPTGNFGNILAAYYAMRMGLPVGRLICASNRNNVLTDFLHKGEYDARRPFHLTTSPSMDILISSNLERMLFEMCGRDSDRLSAWMSELKANGRYTVDGDTLASLQSILWGGWADDAAVRGEINRTFQKDAYLIDPHTAVATNVLRQYREQTGDTRPCVVVSTASPYKFGRAVASALIPGETGTDFELCASLARMTGQRVPQAIAELPTLPIRHTAACTPDSMLSTLISVLP